MRSFLICILLCCSIALSKYSYTDKCYRYEQERSSAFMTYYQYYINRNGIPLSTDYIIYDKEKKEDVIPKWSYYFHYVLSDCKRSENKHTCTRTCESIWFKIWNVTAAKQFVDFCDKEFIGRYADVMKHGCGEFDPFSTAKTEIGQVSKITIMLDGKKPQAPKGYNEDTKCIWEYDILGLWSMVTLVIVCSVMAVAVLILIVLVVFVQKHRSNKRKRLEGSLVQNENLAV
ncbi:hypothetical protein WA538_005144 [Blastocystis sp. DL]